MTQTHTIAFDLQLPITLDTSAADVMKVAYSHCVETLHALASDGIGDRVHRVSLRHGPPEFLNPPHHEPLPLEDTAHVFHGVVEFLYPEDNRSGFLRLTGTVSGDNSVRLSVCRYDKIGAKPHAFSSLDMAIRLSTQQHTAEATSSETQQQVSDN